MIGILIIENSAESAVLHVALRSIKYEKGSKFDLVRNELIERLEREKGLRDNGIT